MGRARAVVAGRRNTQERRLDLTQPLPVPANPAVFAARVGIVAGREIVQQRDENAGMQAIAVMRQGAVVDVSADLALVAAKVALALKLPLADSVILATARLRRATVWTKDSDLKGSKASSTRQNASDICSGLDT